MSKSVDLNASDCLLMEQHVSIVNLDTTEEEIQQPEDKPFLQLIFQDNTSCKSLLERIRKLVEMYLKVQKKQLRVVTDETGAKVDLFADEVQEEGSIFMIDNKPSARLKSAEVPTYSVNEETATLHNGELPARKIFRKANMCFNCGGSHSVNDCRLPRNVERIRKARQQQNKNPERYHNDLEQKFAHIKPGQISENLRRALGIRSRNLPTYVYRMRVLGYPPGWLEEAKISHSGLSLFDSEGRPVRPGTLEVGELDEVREQYNPEEIIDFPGFNVDPPSNYIDESQMHGVPQMMDYHRKEVMFKMFGLEESQPGYKRKRLGELTANSPNGCVPEPQDMDIEDKEESETPPEQHFATSGNEESSQSQKDEGNSQESTRTSSPSLDELQAAQERLLQALNSNNGDDSNPDTSTPRPRTPENRGKSMTTLPGTPILTPFSSYSRLPDGDNWAKGVSGVIDFENLPDTTGKYEKMKTVLEKVRETVCKIHKE
ncbi:Zinc finger CCHC domain-containing protein 8 homolog [Sergentomyia squamirostris]